MSNLKDFYDEKFIKDKAMWIFEDRDDFIFRVVTSRITLTKIIDIGCGNGHTLKFFQDRLPDVEYFGVDISSEAIRLSDEKVTGTFFNVDFSEWSTRRKFDVVLNLGTIEHFKDLEGSMAKLKKLVAAGGMCYFEAPNNLSYSPGPQTFRRLEQGSRQLEWHLTHDAWEEKIINVGFEIVDRIKGMKNWWQFIWILQ